MFCSTQNEFSSLIEVLLIAKARKLNQTFSKKDTFSLFHSQANKDFELKLLSNELLNQMHVMKLIILTEK